MIWVLIVRILREKLLESSDSATTSSRRVSAIKFTYFSIVVLGWREYNRNALQEESVESLTFSLTFQLPGGKQLRINI